MVKITIPEICEDGGRYEWKTFTHVPLGHEWASLKRRPGPLRWWFAKQLLRLVAKVGRCTVTMSGAWLEMNSEDGKLAAVDAARRANEVFKRSIGDEIQMRFVDRVLHAQTKPKEDVV